MKGMERAGWVAVVLAMVFACVVASAGCWRSSGEEDASLSDLVAKYDVIVMKHCYPASDVVEDEGKPNPLSSRQSLENYKAIYAALRAEFDKYPDTTFIVWTLPPLHRRATNAEAAARATEFSEWLRTDFLTENGLHPNICVWDFRGIVMDPFTNGLCYEYERDHEGSDSHPNDAANNVAGPQFAQFLVDTVKVEDGSKIVLLHHSTGGNVYRYPDLGVEQWFRDYNAANGTEFQISELWYPSGNNMPVDYYRAWIAD